MKHLGSVTDIHGGEIEPVDIITFGSPCQDLSVAGKRAGLKHEANGDEETTRSGLFMEAVRIIKEMREATNGKYPTFALWENVPGAFSSNKGEDFRTVLTELIRIVEPNAVMPPVPKAGWNYADSYTGDGWSLAYRVFDAQYWGVPQRRRRIHLVVDFRGERAREILFEREGVRWYFAQGRTPWQRTAANPQGGSSSDDREGEEGRGTADVKAYSFDSLASNSMKSKNPHSGCRQVEIAKTLDTTDPNPSKNQGGGIAVVECLPYTLKIRSGCDGGGKGAPVQTDKSATLATNNDQYLFQPVNGVLLDDQGGQQVNARSDDKCPTLRAEAHGNVPCIVEAAGFKAGQGAKSRSIGFEEERAPTLSAEAGGNSVPAVCISTYDARGNGDGEVVSTITGDHENRITDYTSLVCYGRPAYCLQGNGIDRAETAGCNGKGWKEDCSYTLNTIDRHAVAYGEPISLLGGIVSSTLMARDYKGIGRHDTLGSAVCIPTPTRYIVRRLTPTECARLQGFADRWGDIDKKYDFTDEEYKFWKVVRNTHAEINGKAVKDYTMQQMLSWYNKLHTDSAEYKMWGNGIALPPALYCMQGMVDVLDTTE